MPTGCGAPLLLLLLELLPLLEELAAPEEELELPLAVPLDDELLLSSGLPLLLELLELELELPSTGSPSSERPQAANANRLQHGIATRSMRSQYTARS